jgi:hypothetical protein
MSPQFFGGRGEIAEKWADIFRKNKVLNGRLDDSVTGKYMSEEGISLEDDHIN